MIDRKVSEEEFSSNKKLIRSMIENISLALERIEITIERVRDRQRMERERERANLLRAISHDLRTTLSGIMGSAEMLMDMTEKGDNSATELMARIRVALRHYYRMNQKEEIEKPDDAVYTNGEICLDNGKHMVYKSGQEIHLTPMEYNLLYLFMRNPGKVLTYHTIFQKIWGDGYGEDT